MIVDANLIEGIKIGLFFGMAIGFVVSGIGAWLILRKINADA